RLSRRSASTASESLVARRATSRGPTWAMPSASAHTGTIRACRESGLVLRISRRARERLAQLRQPRQLLVCVPDLAIKLLAALCAGPEALPLRSLCRNACAQVRERLVQARQVLPDLPVDTEVEVALGLADR